MRKIERQMTEEDTHKLLVNGEYGILATTDNDGQPFATPLSYAVDGNYIYFHCATEGTKLDNITANSKVCFTVVGNTKILEEKFSTEFESVMAFGEAIVVEGEEKYLGLVKILEKYSPNFITPGREYIDRAISKTCVVKIKIMHITGKHRI